MRTYEMNSQRLGRISLILGILFGWSCASVGSSDLLGCFIAGIVTAQLADDTAAVAEAFDQEFGSYVDVGSSLFFACTIGFGIPSLTGDGMFSGPALARGALLTIAAVVGKAFPLGLFALPLTWLNFCKFAVIMNGRGEFSYLIADSGRETGVLSSTNFAAATSDSLL